MLGLGCSSAKNIVVPGYDQSYPAFCQSFIHLEQRLGHVAVFSGHALPRSRCGPGGFFQRKGTYADVFKNFFHESFLTIWLSTVNITVPVNLVDPADTAFSAITDNGYCNNLTMAWATASLEAGFWPVTSSAGPPPHGKPIFRHPRNQRLLYAVWSPAGKERPFPG